MQATQEKEALHAKPKKTFSSQLNDFADKFSFGRHSKTGPGISSSKSSLVSGPDLLHPSSNSPGVEEIDHRIADWSRRGFETLPDQPGYRLVSLWSTPDSSLYSLHRTFSSRSSLSSRSSSFYSNPDLDSYGRFIPALVNYRLEWTGPVPLKQSAFDLTSIGPCFLQAGQYEVDLKWLSDVSGEYVSMAATKNLVIKSRAHVLARTRVGFFAASGDASKLKLSHTSTGSNHIGFSKPHGPAALNITKEGWMYRAKDRQQSVRVTIDYMPPVEWSIWSDTDSSPWSTKPNSRRSSFSFHSSRSSSGPALPPIPGSPMACEGRSESEDKITSSVPLDEQPSGEKDLAFKVSHL